MDCRLQYQRLLTRNEAPDGLQVISNEFYFPCSHFAVCCGKSPTTQVDRTYVAHRHIQHLDLLNAEDHSLKAFNGKVLVAI
mgnify:FL=1